MSRETSTMVTKGRLDWMAYGLITALLVVLAYPAVAWLVQSWLGSPYYSHGFLVPVVAALLAWRRWRYLAARPRGSGGLLGLTLMAGGLGAIVWALWRGNPFAASLLLVVLLIAVIFYLEGWPRLRECLFPLLFLAFMVPLPFIDRASPWLEAFTARAAAGLARLVGIAAAQQGGQISLPESTFVVGAACSGLRSLVSMVTLGVGWIYVVSGKPWAKAFMVASILPLVALSNVVRVALLLGVATWIGERAALTYYHDWSSPLLFLLAVGLLLLLGRVLGCHRVRDDI